MDVLDQGRCLQGMLEGADGFLVWPSWSWPMLVLSLFLCYWARKGDWRSEGRLAPARLNLQPRREVVSCSQFFDVCWSLHPLPVVRSPAD
jgi:hypothetical protein